MKIFKYNFPLLLLSIICTITIPIQAQTLYWQKLTPGYYVYDILYDGQQNLYFTGSSGNWYFWRSSDLGLTWTRTGNGNLRLYRLALDSNGVLWSGNDFYGGIYKSTNQGDSWINTFPTSDKIFSITVSPNNWIWAGTLNGKVIYSSDSGNSWITNTIDNDNIFAVTSNSLNNIFVGSTSGNIYRTTNLGTTWETIYSTTLSIWDIVIDESDVIYASNWTRRLISSDNGNNWTTISGPQLERLFIDKYHRIYAGPLGQRSIDNCVTWIRIGPTSPSWVHAYAFVDSLIFAATTEGVYRHDPSYQPYIGDNYFPLAVGNKWQFNRMCYIYFGGNTEYHIESDTIISDKKYYHIQGNINDWVRYDNDVDKFYLRWNDSDYVVMDYTLNEGSTFSQIFFNSHQINTASIAPPIILSIFDSTFHSKGNYRREIFPQSSNVYTTYYSEGLGETQQNFYTTSGGYDCMRTMIRAILHDSSGVKYYSDHVKPEINFQPVFVTNTFNLDWNFNVDHLYSEFNNNWSVNFVDSVIMYSHYSKEDSTFLNETVLAVNTPNSINYSISYLLDSTLMKNDYSFYYKIYAVDKGIVPEYSTKPDSGYYELVYDPNVSVEIVDNKIINYELLQNYPNPFNPVTIINYSIKEEGNVELIIYDVLGKIVERLVDERKTAGNYSTQFDALNLSSGIYFYSLRINDFADTKKMLLIK